MAGLLVPGKPVGKDHLGLGLVANPLALAEISQRLGSLLQVWQVGQRDHRKWRD